MPSSTDAATNTPHDPACGCPACRYRRRRAGIPEPATYHVSHRARRARVPRAIATPADGTSAEPKLTGGSIADPGSSAAAARSPRAVRRRAPTTDPGSDDLTKLEEMIRWAQEIDAGIARGDVLLEMRRRVPWTEPSRQAIFDELERELKAMPATSSDEELRARARRVLARHSV